MSKSKRTSRGTRSSARALVSWCLSVSAVSVMLMAPGVVYAQEAKDEELENIIVTGTIAHSVESSLAQKRKSDSIVEVVASEDLGKLEAMKKEVSGLEREVQELDAL